VFITLAADVAAMSPETHLGAAHPVSIGGAPFPSPSRFPKREEEKGEGKDKKEGKKSKPPASVMEEKAVSDAAAYIRTLAKSKGRNADWAEKAVRESVSLTSDEALKQNVIDVLAGSQTELFEKIEGRKIKKGDKEYVLSLKNVQVFSFEMSATRRFLHTLANPNVAYILLMLGFYALVYEFLSSGMGFGAVVGVICLILAFFSLQILPISYAGLALLFVGVVLMALDIMVTSYGLLSLAGVICLALGSFMLFDSPEPYLRVSLELIGGFVLGTLAFFLFAVKKIWNQRHQKPTTGREGLVGEEGEVKEGGMVYVHGEYWTVLSEASLTPGDKVRIDEVIGNRLKVQRIS